ncbi:AbrB/MazE/SpoVT family DNA-binding domain-containing protein [Pararhizobium sp.]|uniref:AbrB/MazE/SpoVT family DNA-binding domain-containing protein n=1 Tax=Pararhizobium sp. TaxID=1977563 RepID=UPI00271824CB|nr:AbrB/MazE/SpoVT family DNA-binding domain-containing protein [Pararhizobium sp.]MDO9415228.1 AbrB/MazE/SpoVT family DNA-binding domain-containing protein [Pararhizobium sp.]
MRVAKWGNSLAIRLPASVVKALDIKEGDDIRIRLAGTGDLEVSRNSNPHELLEKLRRFRGRLPADFVFDRDIANR